MFDVQVSAAYVTTGPINVLYNFILVELERSRPQIIIIIIIIISFV
jgi:hypothetical protein